MTEPRIPLHSIEAEMSVLGSMLLSQKATDEAIEILVATDFFRPAHQTIFESMSRLSRSRIEIDVITLRNDLTEHGQIANCGGSDYLLQIAEYVPSIANCKHYCQIVQDKATMRRLDESARQILDLIHNPEIEGVEDRISKAEETLLGVRSKKGKATFNSLDQILREFMNDIDSGMETGKVEGRIPTGFYQLDKLIKGIGAGELIIVAGRPAMAKTSIALQLAIQTARQGVPVAIWSAEMTERKIAERLVSSESELSASIFHEVIKNEFDYQEVSSAMEALHKLPISISDRTPNPEDMLNQAKIFQREHGGKHCLFITDYAQLIAKRQRGETTNDAVARTSAACLAIAKDLNCTHVVLSQLSRECEKRDNKRPTLSDLRDSGAIEQDAHIVLGLYRNEYYQAKSNGRAETDLHEAEVICLKNRGGATGTAYLLFEPALTRFRNKS